MDSIYGNRIMASQRCPQLSSGVMPVYVMLHDKGVLQMELRLWTLKQGDHPGLSGWALKSDQGRQKSHRKGEWKRETLNVRTRLFC